MSDPYDKELLDGFREESTAILKELSPIIEKLESFDAQSGFPKEVLEEFAQKIDRIMGAAKTIGMAMPDHPGLRSMGKISELCKSLGYKAAASGNVRLLPLFAAFWGDTLEIFEELLTVLESPEKCSKVLSESSEVLTARLQWLHRNVTSKIAGGGVVFDLDTLLKDLGV